MHPEDEEIRMITVAHSSEGGTVAVVFTQTY